MANLKLSDLSIESIQAQLIESFEEVSDTLQVIDKNWKQLESFGRLLIAAKAKVPHGEWGDWIVDTFSGRLQLRTAQRWVSDVQNPQKAEARREKDREAKSSKATDLSLLKSTESKASVTVVDPDPTPDPPTNRKTAKGSEKTSEDTKPRTQPVLPELIDDPGYDDEPDPVDDWFATRSLEDVCKKWLGDLEDATATKSAAKHLRKLADKLDPPTKFVRPDLEEVTAYFAELKSIDPDSFFDFYESKGWLVGRVSMKDWRASARRWIRENQSNGKGGNGNGAAHRGTGKRGYTADEVFS